MADFFQHVLYDSRSDIIEKNLLARINQLEKLSDSLNEAKETFIEQDENILKYL